MNDDDQRPQPQRSNSRVMAQLTAKEREMLERHRALMSEQLGGEPVSVARALRNMVRIAAATDGRSP